MRTRIMRTGRKDTWSLTMENVTDVRIAYSVVTKYAFYNFASNAVYPSLARVPTQLCGRLWCYQLLQPNGKFSSSTIVDIIL